MTKQLLIKPTKHNQEMIKAESFLRQAKNDNSNIYKGRYSLMYIDKKTGKMRFRPVKPLK